MPQACQFALHAFGCTVGLSSSCMTGKRVLERWVFPSLPRHEYAAGQIRIHIEEAEAGFAIRLNGAVTIYAADEASLALEVIRAVDEAVIARIPRLRAVHAGAVAWRGKALLLPGRSHAGKSSLVAELVRRGAGYLSDEYALIDGEGRVHAYPRPLLARNGSQEQHPVLPESLGARPEEEPLPARWLLALQYRADARWQVEAVSQSEGLLTLLRNTPHVLAEMPGMVGNFRRAVAGSDCYTGQRCDASVAAAEILGLLDDAD